MTEEKEWTKAFLQDEALLRRVLEREPALVSRIVSHADFLEALFSQPESFRGLIRAPLVADDYQFEQLLASVGDDGASLRAHPGRDEARLLDLLNDAEVLGQLFRERPALAAAIATNPAFVEQVKVRKPQFYKALLEKAQERFGKDAELAAEIRAQRESLEVFTTEGGKNEVEAERRQREALEAGEKLLETAIRGHADAVRVLLEKGADPNFQENNGRTALMRAVSQGHANIVGALLEGGANPNLRDNDRWTALVWAAFFDRTDAVRLLLESKADPNLQDKYGKTALIYATESRHTDAMRVLLEGKADPNVQDSCKGTALTRAAISGYVGIVRLLLESKADPNLQDKYGVTALMYAARGGHTKAVRALLEHGADPTLQDGDGKTAAMQTSLSIKEMLAAAERKWRHDDPSGCPARLSIQECAHILIKDDVPVNYLEMRTCEGLRDPRVNSNAGVANILDMDYASNPGEQGPDVFIDKDNTANTNVDSTFQEALKATEQLNQYTCKSSNPNDANADGSSEPPEYAFRDYVRFAYYDAGGNYVDDYLRPNDKSKWQGVKTLIGANMPYLRHVDTGTSADDSGERPGNPNPGYGYQRHGGSFLNTLGSWDAIVGLGRPERSQGDVTLLAANPPQGPEEQASGANPVVDTNYNIKAPAEQSRVGGWLELEEEQALVSERRYDLACLTRPEKVLKPGAALDSILTLLGGQYITQGNPALGIPPQTYPWPDHFPGYEGDTHGHGIPVNYTGLDNAQPGDIVTYTLGADNGAPGLPIAAAVTAVDFSDPNYPNVTVEHWDSPRLALPTGGGTLDFGQPIRQTIYHYAVPTAYQSLIKSHTLYASMTNAQGAIEPSCMDWQYSACVLPMNSDAQGNAIDPWATASIYRPSLTQNIIGCAPNVAGYTEPMSRQIPTNYLAYSVNLGCDSPLTWRADNGQGTYNGPGSADSALTSLILTKPSFFGGSLSADPTEQFFPKGPKDIGP